MELYHQHASTEFLIQQCETRWRLKIWGYSRQNQCTPNFFL